MEVVCRVWSLDADGDAVFFGELEESFGRDAAATGFEAVVVLGIGFLGVVVGVEADEAMEVGSVAFAEGLNEGEAETEPGFVGGCDVSAGKLDAAGDFLDLFFQGGCPAAVGGGCSSGLRSLGFSGPQKAFGRSSCQSARLNSLFIAQEGIRVPGEEAGATDVFA